MNSNINAIVKTQKAVYFISFYWTMCSVAGCHKTYEEYEKYTRNIPDCQIDINY